MPQGDPTNSLSPSLSIPPTDMTYTHTQIHTDSYRYICLYVFASSLIESGSSSSLTQCPINPNRLINGRHRNIYILYIVCSIIVYSIYCIYGILYAFNPVACSMQFDLIFGNVKWADADDVGSRRRCRCRRQLQRQRRRRQSVGSECEVWSEWVTRVGQIGYTLQPHPIADDAQAAPTTTGCPRSTLYPPHRAAPVRRGVYVITQTNSCKRARASEPIGHCDVIVYGQHESVVVVVRRSCETSGIWKNP